MKNIYLAALLFAAGASAPLSAQGVPDVSKVQAGNYKLDSHHTLVLFTLDHLGFNDYFGTFPNATGTMAINPASLAATKLDVSVPVSALSTTNAILDAELKGAEWFDAAKYPTIRFVSTGVTKTGATTADISGNLTLHGVTKPVVLAATFGGAGVNPLTKANTIGFHAKAQIKRTDFGVSKYAPLVGDNVALTITAAFEKAD
ncbi:polyisoprenoid-binding protein [Sphingobium phenoxybenzoativorans]|uniref:Polyisoprenoid-binding protein n=1 Tax=Sphingobium phenoxybenzoativorans TaxID=1592790 RepID=A0A975Q3J8_9SPHN|nr:YceI family protein [Sphingobium phenoxybenzoativorans]QUT07811.1 polyisoprenoid-binding protein [Sphingobium phenoxybenzoativorans]